MLIPISCEKSNCVFLRLFRYALTLSANAFTSGILSTPLVIIT